MKTLHGQLVLLLALAGCQSNPPKVAHVPAPTAAAVSGSNARVAQSLTTASSYAERLEAKEIVVLEALRQRQNRNK